MNSPANSASSTRAISSAVKPGASAAITLASVKPPIASRSCRPKGQLAVKVAVTGAAIA